MQPSPIGLAAALALTFATLGPAHAGFVARSPHMAPPSRPVMTNPAWQSGRFGQANSDIFRRGHDRQFSSGFGETTSSDVFRRGRSRQFPSFGFGYGYVDGPAFSPAADAQPPVFLAGAPIVNVTIVTPAPGTAYSPPKNYVAGIRPKIILIGARPRATHFEKMPIVIYGRS